VHAETTGRHQPVVDPAQCQGVAGAARPAILGAPTPATLLRPLAEYERLLGGSWG
jgi:hypothetical protein